MLIYVKSTQTEGQPAERTGQQAVSNGVKELNFRYERRFEKGHE